VVRSSFIVPNKMLVPKSKCCICSSHQSRASVLLQIVLFSFFVKPSRTFIIYLVPNKMLVPKSKCCICSSHQSRASVLLQIVLFSFFVKPLFCVPNKMLVTKSKCCICSSHQSRPSVLLQIIYFLFCETKWYVHHLSVLRTGPNSSACWP